MSATLRRRLRLLQLAAGVWTAWTLLGLLLAPNAAADNCSVFTDCFGVASSALEAAFGLSLLAALSLVLDFVPVVGTLKGGIEAITGRDLLTGEKLAPWERALGVLPYLGAAGSVAAAMRHLDGIGDLAAIGRHADEGAGLAPGLARHADDAAPPRVPHRHVAGDELPFPPSSQPLVDLYRNPNITSAERQYISEILGERGALEYARTLRGDDAVGLLRPASSADVTPLMDQVARGEPWDNAVAYGGRNATNLVYFDGNDLYIFEAKGGGSSYGDRASTLQPGSRITQTDPNYPLDVADNMQNSRLPDGRQQIGEQIADMYETNRVHYVAVRTGPYQDLAAGNPRIIVEHVFKEP